jgi:hypothetical protein
MKIKIHKGWTVDLDYLLATSDGCYRCYDIGPFQFMFEVL